MSFGDAVKTCFSKYVDFTGRARRSEYWWWALFYVLVVFAGAIVDAVLGTNFVIFLAWLAVILPTIAVGIRRLHDTSKSGWWFLISLVPFVGGIILLIFFVQDSSPDNQYGPSPKGYGAGAATYGQQPTPYGQQNPYGQAPPDPYGQQNPYGQPPPPPNPYGQQDPYGQPPQNPYGEPPQNPYGEPPAQQ